MYKLIDLFCGAGGMTLGFVDPRFCGDFEPTLAVDIDRPSIETHKANFGGKVVHDPIDDWLAGDPDVPKADVVIGGPPCQGFSLLNKNRRGDLRRALWEPHLDIVELSGARMFVMENVSELYRSPELRQIKRRAARIGFRTKEAVLNAADYGAPQTRKRTVIVGWNSSELDTPVFPRSATHAQPGLNSSLPAWRTGVPWIPGYKPARNYQNAIFDAIDRYLTKYPELLLHSPQTLPTPQPLLTDIFRLGAGVGGT